MRIIALKEYNRESRTPSSVVRFVAWFLTLTSLALAGCVTAHDGKDRTSSVTLPYLRLESSECYYLDDFIPTPDTLVTGKNNGLFLRYYTYKLANYKSWTERNLMLSFYSRDNRCWSLFDEALLTGFF